MAAASFPSSDSATRLTRKSGPKARTTAPVFASSTAAGDRSFANAEEVSQYLIREQSFCCVPWDDAGPYLRFSVTYTAKDEAEEDALMGETVRRLKGLSLRF